MPVILSLILLVLLISCLGIATQALLVDDEHRSSPGSAHEEPRFEQSFQIFLTGLVLLSLVMMVLALLGIFSLTAIGAAVALIGAGGVWRMWQATGGSRVVRHLLYGFAVVTSVTL